MPHKIGAHKWRSKLIMGLILIALVISAAAATTATLAVVLRDDWRADALDLLVLVLDLLSICLRVRVQPLLTILECILDLLLLVRVHLLAQTLVLTRTLHCRLHRVHVAIEGVLRIDALLHLLVLLGKLLCLLDHLLNLLLGEAALVIGDCDLLALACAFILSTNVQHAVGVDLEGHFDLRLATWCRRDSTKLELTKQVVVLCHWTFTLIHLDVHSRLVVLVSREDLG